MSQYETKLGLLKDILRYVLSTKVKREMVKERIKVLPVVWASQRGVGIRLLYDRIWVTAKLLASKLLKSTLPQHTHFKIAQSCSLQQCYSFTVLQLQFRGIFSCANKAVRWIYEGKV